MQSLGRAWQASAIAEDGEETCCWQSKYSPPKTGYTIFLQNFVAFLFFSIFRHISLSHIVENEFYEI